jgi:hypothetical protein
VVYLDFLTQEEIRRRLNSGNVSNPTRREIFLYSIASGPVPGPIQLVTNGHRGQRDRSVKLTNHVYLVPRSRMVELYLHYPIRLHGTVLN